MRIERAGAKIGGDRQDAIGILSAKRVAGSHIGAHVRAAEAIDRLLGIADQEQRAGPDPELRSSRCRASAGGSPHRRQKISVCSGSVSWNSSTSTWAKRCPERAADIVVVTQQISRGEDQIVEIELGADRLWSR